MAYSSITKPSLHFNTVLYTGTDAAKSVTGVGFQPDFTWIKTRSHGGTAFPHVLTDAVRGVNKSLFSNTSDQETTNYTNGYLSAFGTDGFTVTAGDAVSGIGRTYVGWNWKAGGGAGSSNTDGSINTTSTSVNTTAGFSISKYTGNGTGGATVGHGLGVVPSMIIIKVLSTTNNWGVYHSGMGATNAMYLDQNSQVTSDGWLNNTAPTSSVFTLSNGNYGNTNGNTHVAYCFAEKKGFSRFGEYVGNGNADGSFIYTGFKPAFVMIKVKSGNNNHWFLFDKHRLGYNADGSGNEYLKTDTNEAESTNTNRIDILSNGFKCKTSNDGVNGNGDTYIYWAIADEPAVANVGTNGIPATAK